MDAKVTWHGRMSFTGTSDSGFEVPLGTDPGVGGDNDGFRPMELMALSLAGCQSYGGGAGLGAALGAGAVLSASALRRIGGQTGDILGASQQLAEVACLAVLSARL